jgi:4,4'-diaponeurosporenoate glycosyltransferase
MWADILQLSLLLSGFILMWKIPRFKTPLNADVDTKKVSILIPARNEEKRIEPLLKSLKTQDFEGELIVIDDESTDQTAAIAASYGAKVIQSKPLPKGWRGKSWALYQGVQAASHDVVMLLDADTHFEKAGLKKILHHFYLDDTPLSIQPYHQMKRPYEQLSLMFNIIILMASNLYTPWQTKFKPRVFYGPVQVMKKDDYHTVGTDKKVNSSVLDDIEMGKVFLENGRPIRALGGQGAVSFRMYPGGFKESVSGWSKSFATGAKLIGFWNMVMVSLWITAIFSIIFRPLILPQFTGAYLGIYALAGIQLYWMGRRVGNFSVLSVVLFPLQALYFLMVFTLSFVKTKMTKNVAWRGRKIDLGDD